MDNRTILRYPGGKFRVRKVIADFFDGCQTVASPFFGGGSVELELASRGKEVYASEIFLPIAELWKAVKQYPERIAIAAQPYLGADRSEFYRLQAELREEMSKFYPDPFECAWRAFVINRTSFSGCTLSGGIGDGTRFTQRSIDRLMEVDLKNLEIECGDYWDVLFKHGQRYDGIYADPPYALENSKLYGDGGDTHESFNHKRFSEHMNTLRLDSRIVISYNDCDMVRDLFKEWTFHPVSWAYGMNKDKKSNEVFIVNF